MAAAPTAFQTHEVFNQVPALESYNAWLADAPLREAVAREGGGWADARARGVRRHRRRRDDGARLSSPTRTGRSSARSTATATASTRSSSIRPITASWSSASRTACTRFAWRHARAPGAHVARAALLYLHNQAEQGTSCPLTMTYACVPALRHQPALAGEWLPRITAIDYDARSIPPTQKRACTIGMGMTEKQGGSDVRANTTRAYRSARGPGQPTSSSATSGSSPRRCATRSSCSRRRRRGLSCFLLPRFAPDGTRNAIRIQRLKDKLGDWSNASSRGRVPGRAGVDASATKAAAWRRSSRWSR